MIKHITDSSFNEEVLNSKGLVLVDFWAPWCGPCKMLGPVLEELAGEMNNNLTIGKVDIDTNVEKASAYKISAVPTMLLFKDGDLVDKFSGFAPKEMLVEFLNKHM
ncbi:MULTISPECIES: thioredoxin [Clostridium]|uniref:Thioredoxin n=1 Tax=Clostridium senegalense TaxID=1465809 RepID=A0A6M0H1I3_9CLOT|nr:MULTISPECIES: thioredoxin [Clostridium]NEU04615.1 thioredoxin [Clostridium senegalense]